MEQLTRRLTDLALKLDRQIDQMKVDVAAIQSAPVATPGAIVIEQRSASYAESATSGEKVVLASGAITISLPSAVGNSARINVKLVAPGTVTITASAGETVEGSASIAIAVLGASVTIVSDGAAWWII